MKISPRAVWLLPAPLALLPSLRQQAEPVAPEWTADQQAVHDTIEDYVLGFYRSDTERLASALSPDLVKLGFWRDSSEEPYGDAKHMTYEQALELAGSRNLEEQRGGPLPYEIELFEVCDKTACGKVTAVWGQDTFQLVHAGGEWRIHHILWQSEPGRIDR